MNLKIDEEFRNKIPPLTEDEFRQLEENIVSDGEVYEPIAVWNGTIVDGHNRWKIIQAHPEIPYKVKEMAFSDKWEAFEWMYRKQLGRRNLTDEQKTYMIGKMYEARKNTVGAPIGNANAEKQTGQNVHIVSRYEIKQGTAGQIGKEFGVDGKTVRRAEKFAKGVETIREKSEEMAEKVLRGETKVTKSNIIDMAEGKREFSEIVDAIKNEKELPKKQKPVDDSAETLISRGNNSAEYGIDDLIEEMRSVNEDFLGKYKTMLKYHANLVTGNAAEIVAVMEEVISEFEKMEEF